eukprot:Gb_19810 [translate_table: standard]
MAYSNIPTSYKALQESVSSIYRGMMPFSLKNNSFRRIGDANPEQKRAKQQSENLKWQQEMFHRILNMMGLHKEGIVSEQQLSATRSELLDTLIASPVEGEWPAITRDKLLFLQELLFAKCISEEDYHLSKRPLLLRLAVQGAEIDSRDVLLGNSLCPNPIGGMTINAEPYSIQETEWSVVEFKDDNSLLKDLPAKSTEDPCKQKSPMKQVIDAMSHLSLTSHKGGKSKDKHPSVIVPQSIDFLNSKDCCPVRNPPTLPIQGGFKSSALYINPTESFKENPFWQVAGLINAPEVSDKTTSQESALLRHSSLSDQKLQGGATRAKVRKVFNQLLQKVQRDHSKESNPEVPYSSHLSDSGSDSDEQEPKPAKRMWGLDIFKSSKKPNDEDELGYLPLSGSSEEALSPSKLMMLKPHGGGPNTKKIKKKIHSNGAATDFFIDKVLGENIKNELSRIRAELSTTNSSPNFTNEQIDAIATRLPVDKNELKKFFPKSWCDRYGDIVLDVVRREFKDHVGEMENIRKTAREKRRNAARQRGVEDDDEYSLHNVYPEARKKDNAKGETPKKSPTDSLNRCFTTQDENSEPNLSSPSSALRGQQPRSPFPFHPMSKPPSPFTQPKSPSPFNSAKHDSPSSPSLHQKTHKSSSPFTRDKSQSKSPSPFLQENRFKAARNLYTEMSLESQVNENLEEETQRMLPKKTADSATCLRV